MAGLLGGGGNNGNNGGGGLLGGYVHSSSVILGKELTLADFSTQWTKPPKAFLLSEVSLRLFSRPLEV
jgi:hypothetical protein